MEKVGLFRPPFARVTLVGCAVAGMAVFLVARKERTAEPEAPARPVLELIDALRDDSPAVRAEAAAGLLRWGPAASPAVAALLAALRDESAVVRAHAAAALGRVGPSATVPLTRALNDENPFVRRGAIAALGIHGATSASLIEAVAARLSDPDDGVRFHAAATLIRFGPAAEAQALAALRSRCQQTREAAAETLAAISPLSARARAELTRALADDSPVVRQHAKTALLPTRRNPALHDSPSKVNGASGSLAVPAYE
jgi:HEAT repeat protein